ncbi:MAG: SLBB domain-containing protein [Polymorphobacter sp.]|uniref:SLBB domain-containing protein n=1 Tax=Polymorphobacter sp. TaxID=1909290 RepID=UPI003A869EB1
MKRLLVLAGLCAGLCAGATAAQTVDPAVLRQVQGSLGAGTGAQDAGQGVDEAARGGTPLPAGQRLDTREEQAVRRAQARAELEFLYRPSAVERDYRQRMGVVDLRQFGYDLFESVDPSAASVTGTMGDDYVLGVGDELIVQFQGASNESRTARVARDGQVVVGSLPPVQAGGRSLGAVRRELEAATERTLLGTDIFVSLGAVRAASVFVGGEVARPGQYSLTSLSDVAVALAQAGGVRRNGSLRQVRVVRGGRTLSVDLYGLLGLGGPPGVRLQDGDRVIVPVIGPTVAISGNVTRPGIYELRGPTKLGELLRFAGGAVRQRGYRMAVSRIGEDGAERFLSQPSLETALVAGDAVQLSAGSAGGASGRVILSGFVDNPGPRALGAVRDVAGLLGDAGRLKPGSYLPMALLVRRETATASRSYLPVDLAAALDGRQPVPLRSEDQLFVFSQSDIRFLNTTAVRRIVLGQPNALSQCLSLDRLEAQVRDSQTSRFTVVTRQAFLVERNGRTELASTGGTLSGVTRSADAAVRTGENLAGLRQRGTEQQGEEQLFGPGTAETRRGVENDGAIGDTIAIRAQCPVVFELEPDLLPVLIENAVAVGGAVRRPGAYPVAGSASAATLAAVAEGVLNDVSGLTLDVARGQGGAVVSERVEVPDVGGEAVMAATMLRAGDDIRFNAAQPQFEAGAVLLSGEFNRPGLYSIRRGETLSQLIERAGGLSAMAYPYGTIFTRRSVRELQQEGLRRTSRELTQGLLSLAARSRDANGGGVVAGQQLIEQLNTLEAPGRVVVEADPRVLAMRPDLDTVLESGDAVVMPKKPNFVLALGDVANPGALQFVAGKDVSNYLSEAGGTASTADEGRIFIVLPDGTAQPLKGRGWGKGYAGVVPPGSTIIVPKDIDPLYKLDLARDITGILTGLLTSVATVAILATN